MGAAPSTAALEARHTGKMHAGQTWRNQAQLVQGLPGVGSQVAQQVGVAAEAAATLRAGVGPGPRVHQHVPQ